MFLLPLMKRRRSAEDDESESDSNHAVVDVTTLHRRLQDTMAFGLKAGETTIDLDDKAELTLKSRKWTREDGTVVKNNIDKGTGNILSIDRQHLDEEDYGPSFRTEEFERQDMVNRDPRVAWLRLLAGHTHEEVEDMFDEGDVRNQRIYDEELKAWNKLERERIMVGSADKKAQLDMIEEKRASLRTERENLLWSRQFFDNYAEDMSVLLTPLLGSDGSLSSLTLCIIFDGQYTFIKEALDRLVKATLTKDDVSIDAPFRQNYLRFFDDETIKECVSHELADTFLAKARDTFDPDSIRGSMSYRKFEQFVLFIYKYLFTRDHYKPDILTIQESVLDADGTFRYSPVTKSTSIQQLFYETTKTLFFLYKKSQTMQLLFLTYGPEKGDTHPSEDIEYFSKLKELNAQKREAEATLKAPGAPRSKVVAAEKSIKELSQQISELQQGRAFMQRGLLQALKSPATETLFKDFFKVANGASQFSGDPILKAMNSVMGDANAPLAKVAEWFRAYGSQPQVAPLKTFIHSGMDDRLVREYFIHANMAFLMREVTFDGVTDEFRNAFNGLTEHGRQYIAATLFSSPWNVMISSFPLQVKFTAANDVGHQMFEHLKVAFPSFKLPAVANSNPNVPKIHMSVTIAFKLGLSPWQTNFLNQCKEMRTNLVGVVSAGYFNDTLENARARYLTQEHKRIATDFFDKLQREAFTTTTDLDIFNVVAFKAGVDTTWLVGNVSTQLNYFNLGTTIPANAILDETFDIFMAGSMASLALFLKSDRVVNLFQSNVLSTPIAQYYSLMTPDSKSTSALLKESKELLKSLDSVMKGVAMNASDEKTRHEIEAFLHNAMQDRLVRKFAIKRHASTQLILFIRAWVNVVFPGKSAQLTKDLDTVDKAITDAQSELYRLAMGTTASIKDQRDKVKELYTPSARWQMRPEFTGRVTLAPRVVAALDQALTTIREYVPSLSNATLDALMLCDMESGLPGAFARFVASLMNNTQLTFPHTYNKDYQYRLDPKFRQDSLNALRNYSVSQTPDGKYVARRTRGGGEPSESRSESGKTMMTVFYY
jgi:hypothetical protein